jgi:glyoxylase-like metal-dependent hydrolase (beta-lactamase superfamily II)
VGWLELGDGVFCRRYEPWDVTVGVVVGAGGVLLIDTRANPAEGAELRDDLRRLDRRPPRWVVNTHQHFDHIGGNGCFPEAEIYAATDATIDLGDRTANLHHPGRGHTGEDILVTVPGVVFAGDLVEESGPLQYDELSFPDEWPATNRRLITLIGPGDRVVPGHGAVVGRAFVIAQQKALDAKAGPGSGG